MLDRKEIKASAKAAFKANYWRCVVVALIMALIIGGGAAGGKNRVQHSVSNNDYAIEYDLDSNGSLNEGELRAMMDGLITEYGEEAVLTVAFGVLGVLMTFAAAGSLVTVFVINPLSVGCKYFFYRNQEEPAEIGEVSRGFTPAWWNNVVTLFLYDLFLLLWSMLFVIPGIVKAFSYRLVPYIRAEHPEMGAREVITLSRRMMNGHKWEAFVFDLSFIGWYILEACTAGIAGVLWVNPYKAAADAELYRAIRDDYRG